MAKKVTMQQIADYAGVSKYAVSKALSGQAGVSEETRIKIVKIATQLGYFLQRHTQPVSRPSTTHDGRKANTVVILLPNVRMQHRESTYWGRIIDGITMALKERGLAMITITEHSPDNFLQVLNPSGLSGIIGVGFVANPMLLEIRKLGVPFVLVDHEDESVPSDTLFVDNFGATRRLTNHLIAQGHTAIQFIGDIHFSQSFFDRWLAFRTALEESKIPVPQNENLTQVIGSERTQDTLRILDQIRQMSSSNCLPTAFVCANDSIAISAMRALGQADIRVPQNVSVTGFDDIDDTIDIRPALTTVHVHKEQFGARAVDVLLRRMANPEAPHEKVLVSGTVVFRDSVSPVLNGEFPSKRG